MSALGHWEARMLDEIYPMFGCPHGSQLTEANFLWSFKNESHNMGISEQHVLGEGRIINCNFSFGILAHHLASFCHEFMLS